jgi:hypothetical protein
MKENAVVKMSGTGWGQALAREGAKWQPRFSKVAKTMVKVLPVLAVGALVMSGIAHAEAATVTIPDCLGTGVGVADYISSAITKLGSVVAVVVGGFFAFRIIKMGLRWIGVIG